MSTGDGSHNIQNGGTSGATGISGGSSGQTNSGPIISSHILGDDGRPPPPPPHSNLLHMAGKLMLFESNDFFFNLF